MKKTTPYISSVTGREVPPDLKAAIDRAVAQTIHDQDVRERKAALAAKNAKKAAAAPKKSKLNTLAIPVAAALTLTSPIINPTDVVKAPAPVERTAEAVTTPEPALTIEITAADLQRVADDLHLNTEQTAAIFQKYGITQPIVDHEIER